MNYIRGELSKSEFDRQISSLYNTAHIGMSPETAIDIILKQCDKGTYAIICWASHSCFLLMVLVVSHKLPHAIFLIVQPLQFVHHQLLFQYSILHPSSLAHHNGK